MKMIRGLLVATALLAACGTSGCAAGADPIVVTGTATAAATQDPAPSTGSAPWAPKGAAPVRQITSAGDGEIITVKLGDRVGFPASEPGDFGGYRVTDDGGALVPYGSLTTWLATAPGTAQVVITRYDRTRPCVPPAPVGKFTIKVTSLGIRPSIPASVGLPAGTAVTVHLVSGQQLRLVGVGDAVSSHQSFTTNDGAVIRAIRPGTDEYSLWTDRASRGNPDRSLTVVVDDPDTAAKDTAATRPNGLRATGNACTVPAVSEVRPARCG